MIKPIFAVKDVKTTFWKPFIQLSIPAGVREFDNLINSGNEFATQNYADLELWQLGTYDEMTGEIISSVEYVCCGRDFVKVGDANGK